MGLVAVGAVIFSLVPGGSVPNPAPRVPLAQAAGREATTGAAAATNEPLRPLCEYLDMVGLRPPAAPCSPPTTGEPACPEDDYHPVRFLIATVPDPIDSHFAQSFDRAVDAIQNGMQDIGYVLDRFYLPWKRESENRWNIARLQPGAPEGFLSVNAKSSPPDLHRNLPGTLLFRATERLDPKIGEQLVVVFLVGETPTAGVQRIAMTRALEAIVAYPGSLQCVRPPEGNEIRILGPYFSGSTDSLHHLLWYWNKRHKRKIEIVSGSATVGRNLEELTAPGEGELDEQISFHATVVPDEALTTVFYNFLKKRLGVVPEDKVALFVEGGTSYGSGYKDISSGRTKHRDAQGAGRPKAATNPSDNERRFRFVVSFPLHVSQLRSAYEKEGALKNSAPGVAPRQSLELALESPEATTRDILPAQDARMASNIADLFLTSSVETIRREQIRFVGIVASDPRDILFLARKIRENAANVTLFTFGADILYTHPDYERYLRGMLIVTPYPLFPANQAWTGSTQVRISFAGPAEEGIYNAVLYQLRDSKADPRPLLEFRPPFPPESPGLSDRPPIWIMAVGRRGLWPVDILPSYVDKGYVVTVPISAPSGLESRRYHPPGGILTFVLLESLFLGVMALYIRLRKKAFVPVEEDGSRRAILPGGLLHRAETILSVWSSPVAREINRTYLLTLLVLFVFVQSTVVVYLLRVASSLAGAPTFAVGAVLVLLGLLAVLGWEVSLLVSSLRESAPETQTVLRHAIVPGALLALIGGILVLYWIDIFTMSRGQVVSFYARAFDLSSSISPLLPLLLTISALMLWALSNIQRAFLLEVEGDSRLGAALPPTTTLIGLPELENALQRLLEDPLARAAALLGPALLLLPFYQVVVQDFDSIDGESLSRLFKFLLLSSYFVILYSFTLFFTAWLRVRRLLQRLAWHSIAEAFKRLPDSVAASPWRMWNAVPSLNGLEASVSLLETLVNLGSGPLSAKAWDSLKEDAAKARKLLDGALVESNRSFSVSLPTQHKLRRLLVGVTVGLLTPLEEVWRNWPSKADAGGELQKAGDQEQFRGVEEWIRSEMPVAKGLWVRAAEEFVAMRLSSYTHYVFLHMKNLLMTVVLEFLLIVAAISSYPFEPKHLVMALIWVVAVACVALVAWAFIGMNRDRILSYIGKTTPGEVTMSFEFLSSMTIYVIVPLLTLLATQFPGLGDRVFSLFTPAMKSLR